MSRYEDYLQQKAQNYRKQRDQFSAQCWQLQEELRLLKEQYGLIPTLAQITAHKLMTGQLGRLD